MRYGNMPSEWPRSEREAVAAQLWERYYDRDLPGWLDGLATFVDLQPGLVRARAGSLQSSFDNKLMSSLRVIAKHSRASRTLADVLKEYPTIVAWLKCVPNRGCHCVAPKRWNSPLKPWLACNERSRSFCDMLAAPDLSSEKSWYGYEVS